MRETSAEAKNSIDSKTIESIVFEHIRSSGIKGCTCDEAEESLGLRHQTCSARFTALNKKGEIVDSGKRRLTRSGRNAIVWLAMKKNEQARLF